MVRARQFPAAAAVVMGFAVLAGIACAAAALLWRFGGLARPVWTFVAAAMMLGAAGYSWQGRPSLAGSPVAAGARTIELDPALLELRGAMTERYGTSANWLVFSDALLRQGDTQMAVLAIRSGIDENPRSSALWAALGSALVEHDGGAISPTARFAFARATVLDPTSPAPWFFLGVAELHAGNPQVAERLWTRATALTPRRARYWRDVAGRLDLLRRLLAADVAATGL